MSATTVWVDLFKALINADPMGILAAVVVVQLLFAFRSQGRTQQLLEHIVKRLLP